MHARRLWIASSMHAYCFSICFSVCVCEKFGRKFGPFLSMFMVCEWMFNFSNTCMSVVRTCMHEVSMASAIVDVSHIHVWCCVCSCLVIIDDNCDGFLGVVLTIFLMVAPSTSCMRCMLWHHMCVMVGIGGGINFRTLMDGENVGVGITIGACSYGFFSCWCRLQCRKCCP